MNLWNVCTSTGYRDMLGDNRKTCYVIHRITLNSKIFQIDQDVHYWIRDSHFIPPRVGLKKIKSNPFHHNFFRSVFQFTKENLHFQLRRWMITVLPGTFSQWHCDCGKITTTTFWVDLLYSMAFTLFFLLFSSTLWGNVTTFPRSPMEHS